MNKDQPYEQYLKILSVSHFVVGAITGLFACFPVIHLVIGIALLSTGFSWVPVSYDPDFPAAFFGLLFTALAGSIMIPGWTFTIGQMVAGYSLAKRKHYTFCLFVAGVECLFVPLAGTALGVLTIITLVQPSVKEMFIEKQAASEGGS